MLSLNKRRWFSPAIMSFLMALLSLQFVACGTIQKPEPSTEATSPTYKPVTIHNCGQTLTFTRAPMRVISTMQNTTDILLALGLGSHIVGIYYRQLYQSEPEFNNQYTSLNDLGGDMMSVPPKEKILSLHPDFVFSAYPAGDFLASYGEVTQDQFKAQGAQIYGMSGECTDHTTQVQASSVYDDILTIGRIFGVEARAQQVVNGMKARIEAIQKRVINLMPTDIIAMPVFSATQTTAPITVVGAGIYTDVLHQAGGNNLFRSQNITYPSIGQEAFAAQKPQVYVLIVYKGANSSQLASYLFSTYPNTPASKQHRIVTVNASQWNAGIFLPATIEQLARAFHPEVFS